MDCPWKVGDRVIWPHPERDRTRRGAPYRTVRTSGTVIAIDDVAGTRGVRVALDEPVRGVTECYATYAELELANT